MKKKILFAVIIVAVLIVASASMFTVRENEYACTVRRACTSRYPSWTA